MINVSSLLKQSKINVKSVHRAVEDVRNTLQRNDNICNNATSFLRDVYELREQFENPFQAVLTVQSIVQRTVEMKCDIGNAPLMFAEAKQKADKMIADPLNAFMFVPKESSFSSSKPTQDVQSVVEGLSKVAVNKDGKIRKGGKSVLAAELYAKHVTNSTPPMSNKEFVALLMDNLQMSKAGANTYLHNLKKALTK